MWGMVNRIKLLGIGAVLILSVGATFVASQPAFAASTVAKKAACESAGGTWTGSACNDKTTGSPETAINNAITEVIDIFSMIVGIIAVIMIIYGGFKFVTSAGDANNVKTSKSIITYAIVGLIVVALAQVIVRFVLERAT